MYQRTYGRTGGDDVTEQPQRGRGGYHTLLGQDPAVPDRHLLDHG